MRAQGKQAGMLAFVSLSAHAGPTDRRSEHERASDGGPIPRGDQISAYIHGGDRSRSRDGDRVVLVVSACVL